ncbi:MAG: GTP-binding protein [Phycisphaerae bacterium]|nr:GTP-binding protein [Phycisphaerae bacterium]
MAGLTTNNLQPTANTELEQMSIVVIGHVDHGKSTVVGRLLADTQSLPEGKLEDVKAQCKRNSKPFEYAFLLDALKDEQDQGITIDSARCFFKSDRRQYIIIDAPGHIEFLKNMISGAARAEAAVLVIDAKEGVQENSRRHGYLLSMLGIRQVVVVVNKMDLVAYDESVFDAIETEYTAFLGKVGIQARYFIPVSAREGDNIATRSPSTPWFTGPTVLESLDNFVKEPSPVDQPFRCPVQDIYKFTEEDDDRRIVAGRVESGVAHVGDEVVFLPSGKTSTIATVEGFNLPVQAEAVAGQSTGFTLTAQVYVKPGEIMVRQDEIQPQVGTQLKVNIFWMGRRPLVKNKRYKLKLATAKVPVWLRQVNTVLDASELTTAMNRQQIERHDVAECVLETLKPVAFDQTADIAATGRFVIIDNYEIAGGGVILEPVESQTNRIQEGVTQREKSWQRSQITGNMRAARYGQRSTLVILSGLADTGKNTLAKALEESLFQQGRFVYYLGLSNALAGLDADSDVSEQRDQYLRRLGEVSHLFTDAGMILIATVSGLDDYELAMIRTLNHPSDDLVINVGDNHFKDNTVDLQIDRIDDVGQAVTQVQQLLASRKYLIEYYL